MIFKRPQTFHGGMTFNLSDNIFQNCLHVKLKLNWAIWTSRVNLQWYGVTLSFTGQIIRGGQVLNRGVPLIGICQSTPGDISISFRDFCSPWGEGICFYPKVIIRFGNSFLPEAQLLSEWLILPQWEINTPHKGTETNCYNKLISYLHRCKYCLAWSKKRQHITLFFFS